MSWSTSSAGRVEDVAAKVAIDLRQQSSDDAGHAAIKKALSDVAAALAICAPNLFMTFETNGHAYKDAAYGTLSFKTYQIAPLPSAQG